MDCPICGKETVWGSKYCQKCGGRIDSIGIKRSEIIKVLLENTEKSEMVQRGYNDGIEKIRKYQVRKVRLIHSSFEGIDFSDLITEDRDGVVNIKCESELFLRLGVVFIVNEMDSMHNEILELSTKIHDDRIAHIETAFRQYKRALNTSDSGRKERILDFATNECLLGLSMVKRELQRHIDYFAQLPRSTWAKMIGGTNPAQLLEILSQCQEAFNSYCSGVRLLIETDSICGELERVQETIREETEFLDSLLQHDGYKRLLEVDDTNVDSWRDLVDNLAIDMYYVNNCIEEKETILRLEW